jgi:hypothetical protein
MSRQLSAVIAAAVVGSGLALSAVGGAAPASAAGASSTGGGSFTNPATQDRPMYRFWSTGGLMTKDSIEQQVAQIKAAGAGGLEADTLPGISYLGSGNPGYDPATHAFGTPEWTRAWTQLFQAGAKAGLEVDSLYTSGWSAGIPGISPDESGTAKELVYGSAHLDAGQTFDAALPVAALPSGVTKRTLQGVAAYRCTKNCDGTGTPVLDPTSMVDLSSDVADDHLTWTAPNDGHYVVVASWMEGTGQTIFLAGTSTPSYMVDHFGASGSQAIIDFWENNVLTPELRTAMKASGGSLFFDSLELNRNGDPVRFWTDNFLTEFQKRRGYSLVPYLPVLATADNTTLKSTPSFDFSGGVGERVRQDYQQTLSDLFVANHIDPLKDWAHSYDMNLRGQGYLEWGPGVINDTDAALALDIPEQEANNTNSATNPLFDTTGDDKWRQITSANAQAGRTLVSSETGTFGRADGLARKSLVAKMNLQFAVGMNHVIYHGWPDQSPGAAAAWPGYFPFRDGAPDNYGEFSPTINDDKLTNDYVARTQTVLRRGQLRDDVAVLWDGTGAATYDDAGLANAGYSYGFMNNTLVNASTATLKNGELTSLGYRALVIDATGTSVPMDLATAKRIRTWAHTGFPVVVVGDLAQQVRGNRPAQDSALRSVLDDLLAQDSVTTVNDRAEVTKALAAANITPAASYDASLMSLHRRTTDSDYYYLFNSDTKQTTTSVVLTGSGRPYRYNSWTGAVTPIASYTRVPGGVRVEVDLASGDSDLIALTTGNSDNGTSCAVAATSTTADAVTSTASGALTVRDTTAGTYRATLSNGKTVTSTIPTVGAAITPTTWTLAVTSWHGGSGGPNDTEKTPLDPIALTADADGTLPDWQNIDGLEAVSGTSTYTTSIDTGAGWSGGTGAYLDLGTVYGTAQVSVNGEALPPANQVDLRHIDLGGYLRAGANTVVVHVATPVYNAGLGHHDAYGLVGPISLQPYGQATIADQCAAKPVTKQASITHLTATPHRVTKGGKRVTAKVRVTAHGALGGQVTFTLDGRRLATKRLDAKDRTTLRLPAKLKVGRHTLTAHYAGDAATAPSAATVKIRVVRRR